MSDPSALLHNLASRGKAMSDAGVMPVDREPVMLTTGEINMIVRALILLDAVRGAISK